MEAVGVERIEICAQGLREGIFYERFLAPADPPLIPDVRRSSVLNLVDDVPLRRAPRRAGLPPRARDLRRAGAAGPAARRPARARAAVGRRDAPRRRRDGGLQRPPQARLLPDPERRPAGLRPRRAGPGRAAGARPPQGACPPPRRSRRSSTTATTTAWPAGRAACASPSSSSGARRRHPRRAAGRPGRRGRPARCAPRATPRSPIWSAGLEAPAVERAFGRRLEVAEDRAR